MKTFLVLMTLSFSFHQSAFAMQRDEMGQHLGNNLNTCVGCALRAAQVDQRNREAGKLVEDKALADKREETKAKSY